MDEEEDVKIEPETDEEMVESRPEDKIAKMREELSVCRKEKQEYMDGWQRAKADYVNLLKRIEGESKASELRGKMGVVRALLPTFDALERSKEHGEIPEGFLAIARQLEGVFATLGVTPIGKIGEAFDPALHEALGEDITENPEMDNTVSTVWERGWKIGISTELGTGNFIISPAKVRVAHFASEKQEA